MTLFYAKLLASYQTLLYRYSGQSAINVGVPNAGRGQLETEGLIGFFINIPSCAKRDRRPANACCSLLQQVKRNALWAQAHQDPPFEQLVDARSRSAPEPQPAHQQQIGESVERQLPGLSIERMDWQQYTAQFDLRALTSKNSERLHASLTYACDAYDAATIERLVIEPAARGGAGCRSSVSLVSPLGPDEQCGIADAMEPAG